MEELQALQGIFEGLTLNTNMLTCAVGLGIVADFVTGIAKGYMSDKKIVSSKLRDGGFKKMGIILVVLLSYGLSMLFNDANRLIFNGVQAYYVYTELVSIIENLIAMNVNLPPILKKIIGKEVE